MMKNTTERPTTEKMQIIANYAYCIMCVIIIFAAGYQLGRTNTVQAFEAYAIENMSQN